MSETVIVHNDNSVVVQEENITVQVATQGLQGPPGPRGATGAVGGTALVHVQSTPVTHWGITHNFDREPNVVVMIDNEYVMADITYPDLSTVIVGFGEPQTGKAILT